MKASIRLDMRQQPPSPLSSAELYNTALDMCAWADGDAFASVLIGEHHAAEDSYVSSPIVLASAIAARTSNIRIHLSALLLTLHDPIRLAEDLAVLDLVSGGRVSATLGVGYRRHEFDLFGIEYAERVPTFERKLQQLLDALEGRGVSHGKEFHVVTPRPIQRPRPTLYLAGSSKASARRAVEAGLGYRPAHPSLYDEYVAHLKSSDLPAPAPAPNTGPGYLFITRDVDDTRRRVARGVVATNNTYAKWAAERGGGRSRWGQAGDESELLDNGTLAVVTPEECVLLLRDLGPHGEALIQPLVAGVDPDIGWKTLRLFRDEVYPHVARQ